MYLDYPTVVNVNATNPYEIVQPAITICNVNRKRRSFICSLEGNECTRMNNEEFCDAYPLFCPYNNPQKAFPLMPFLNDLMDRKNDWEYSYLESHNETMIDRCKMKLEEKQWRCRGLGCLVVMVTNSWSECHGFESGATEN
ncbi:uncharacterized protein TNCV_1127271 [Trichonephila clavipes]|nr:uncharacterized protein TNCV_1127271 [Trichonephila clavipes]